MVLWECVGQVEVLLASNWWFVRVMLLYFGKIAAYCWDNLGRLIVQSMRQMLVESDEVCDVDVAVVLFRQHIFADLVAVQQLAPDCDRG